MWRGIETHPASAAIPARPGSSRSASAASARRCTRSPRCARSRTRCKLEVPLNAQYIRNLILIAHALHDHIVHFYHLSALDWVDVVSALKADPAKTAALAESLSDWTGNCRDRDEGGAGQGEGASSTAGSSASSRTATGAIRR